MDEAQALEKAPIERFLKAWGISERKYETAPHDELFLLVEELVCLSNNPDTPDSSITLFRRGSKWGFAISVWSSLGLGVSWPPVIQCQPYASQDEARSAGIEKFIQCANQLTGGNERLLAWAKSLSGPQQMSLF